MDIKRKNWIDMARAVGIFAIVYGHMVQGESIISQFFGSFRVAIFFFVMGLTFKYRRGFLKFAKKRAIRVLIPYFCFAFVSILIFAIVGRIAPSLVEGQEIGIISNIVGALYGNGYIGNMKWNRPLWFLPCSFITSMIIFFAEYVIQKAHLKYHSALRFMFVVLSICMNLVYCKFFMSLRLPFGSEVAISMSGFMEMGILFESAECSISKKGCFVWLGLLLIIAGGFLSVRNGYVSVMSLYFGSSVVVYYITAIAIIIGISFVFIWIDSFHRINVIQKSICYCGIHTLAILCMHKFPVLVFQYISPLTKDLLRVTSDSVEKNCIGCLLTIIVIALCLIVEKPIEHYCPIILGIESTKQKRTQLWIGDYQRSVTSENEE